MSNSVNFSTKLSSESVEFGIKNKSQKLNFNTQQICPSLQTVYEEIDVIKTGLNEADQGLKTVLTKVEDMEELVAVLNSDAETDGSVDNKIRKAIQWKTL